MSISPATTQQVHTVLGGGIRYETAELVLGKIDENAFVQEIQDALDEQQNNFDSLIADKEKNIPSGQPFAFETQTDTNMHSESTDDSLQQPDNNILNETVTIFRAPNDKENQNQRRQSSWTSKKVLPDIKNEAITPPKFKRRKSSRKTLPSVPSMRQMTMTQLFDPIESPKSTRDTNPVKEEPNTPSDDAMMFMPESIIGLAQPSGQISDTESELINNLSDLISPAIGKNPSIPQSLKRKLIDDDEDSEDMRTSDDEEEDIQNEALLQTPYSNTENEELLHACPMCRNYWLGLPEELRRKQGLNCRHRQRPVVRTPEHFWSLGIPSTQTCIQRGYGGVLPPDKPIERPRRPRRQYQRRLQEMQQQEQNDQIEDEEN